MDTKMSNCCSNVARYFLVFLYLGAYLIGFIAEILEDSDIKLNPNDWCRITDVEYQAVVTDDPGSKGKVVITEKLTFDVHAASTSNTYWELWRDLPEMYVDGVKTYYRVLSVNQIMPNGQKVPYKESSKLYWDDSDYVGTSRYVNGRYEKQYGPGYWFHSPGPYNPSRHQYECVLFYIDDIYRETMQFEVTYEMYNAALKYGDCSELYLSMYSEDTIKYLKSYKGQILVPQNLMPKEGNYAAHTFGTNSNQFPFVESDYENPGFHTFSFELNENQLKFSPYNQYLEFTLVSSGDDRHIFTQNASENDYTHEPVLDDIIKEQKEYDNQPLKYAFLKILVFVLSLLIVYLIILKTKKHDEKVRQKHSFFKPEFDFEYFRDIPSDLDPIFASHLAFIKDTKKKEIEDEYGAIILSLVRKKYIAIEKIETTKDWSEKNTKFTFLDLPTDSLDKEEAESYELLTKSEKYFYDLMRRYATFGMVTLSQLQYKIANDYTVTETFLNNIKRIPKESGIPQYYQTTNYTLVRDQEKKKAVWKAVWGILILVLGNYFLHRTRFDYAFGSLFMIGFAFLWSFYYLRKKSGEYLLLTQFGEDEYAKWHGLYQFLNNETLLNEAPIESLGLWEKYLIYATAFGIPDKVLKVLKVKVPEFNLNDSPVLSNHYIRSSHFRTTSRDFHSSTRSASARYHASTYSSYSYGGYGGYGGGGRGGGGGGGGH